MHIVHLSVNTSGVSKSSSDWLNYTGFPWDKDVSRQTPSRKNTAVMFTNVTANTYQGQLNARFSKLWEIFNVCGIESLKYIREFHTHRFVIMATFPRHTPETWRCMKQTVIGCLTCRSNMSIMGGPWPWQKRNLYGVKETFMWKSKGSQEEVPGSTTNILARVSVIPYG